MGKKFTLGKKERLKSRKQIEQLFSEGKSFTVFPYKVFYYSTNGQQSLINDLQFGVGVSTRNFKKAVDRNRVKRVTREAWRLQKNELKDKLKNSKKELNVFLIFTGKELPEYNFVQEKLTVILNKLKKLVDENNTSHT